MPSSRDGVNSSAMPISRRVDWQFEYRRTERRGWTQVHSHLSMTQAVA